MAWIRLVPAPRRRVRVLIWSLLCLAGTGIAALECATPSVGSAPRLVAVIDAAHGSAPVQISTASKIAKAIVATEDERFFSHHGIDTVGAIRGAWGFLTRQDLGGSTIDAQLAKVLYVHDEGFFPPAREMALALKFEGHFSKGAILSMYLSAIYFGDNNYGILAASRGYFGVAPQQLTWAQASLLAGLPKAPSALNPRSHLLAAKQRQAYVLGRLVADSVLTRAQADAAMVAPLGLTPQQP